MYQLSVPMKLLYGHISASKNKKTAWEFIKYALGTTEGQKAMYESQGLFPGYLPFIKEDLNTPDEFFTNPQSARAQDFLSKILTH